MTDPVEIVPQADPVVPEPIKGDPVPQADPKVEAKPDDAAALLAKIATLEAALADTNKSAANQVTDLSTKLAALESEAASERRNAALTRIGLPQAYHDVAPQGDPRDPKVAERIEQWASAHPLLLQSRAPTGPQVDLAELAKRMPGGGKGMTSMANMQSNWNAMRGEG
jgi:hypothetical protein